MTRRLRQLSRMLTIQRVLMKHGLDEIVWRTHLFRPLAWLGRLLAFGRRRLPLGVRLRQALEELGPVFVKFGQALSVRPDLWNAGIAQHLLAPTMELLDSRGCTLQGLFTFAQSPKHVGLYQRFDFWPRQKPQP